MKKRIGILLVTVLLALVFTLQLKPAAAYADTSSPFSQQEMTSMTKKVLQVAQKVARQQKQLPGQNPAPIPAPTPTPTPIPDPTPTPIPDPTPIPTPKPEPGTDPNQSPAAGQLKPAAGLTREVVGYYTRDWSTDLGSQRSLDTYGPKMAAVAPFAFQLKADGTFTGSAPAEAITDIHLSGGKALVLIHNCINSGFDGSIVHAVVTDPALRAKTLDNLLDIIKANDFDGVNVDLENIPGGDRAAYSQFISELAQRLHDSGYLVTISVPAKTSDTTTGWGGAFDYKAIGAVVDRMMLMTYDEHWFGGAPGPVASAGWVEQVIGYAVSLVPAEKVMLGLGMYGYDWNVTTGRGSKTVASANAISLANQYGAAINWDSTAQVPWFSYTVNGEKHVVWFESNHSVAFKLNMVNKYNLAGVAIWKLGYEDSGFWQLIDTKFAQTN